MLSILCENPLVYNRISQRREVATLTKIIRPLLPEQIRQSLKRRIKGDERRAESHIADKVEKAIHPLDPIMVRFFAAKTMGSIDKAKRILNYQPNFNFESGMSLTKQWAKWANLL